MRKWVIIVKMYRLDYLLQNGLHNHSHTETFDPYSLLASIKLTPQQNEPGDDDDLLWLLYPMWLMVWLYLPLYH